MRVIAGLARGRRLIAPSGTSVRPTSDRVKESTFNRLESLGLLRDASVLDLFAGSGALGIEALSRGAGSVTFVDSDRAAVRAIETNLSTLGFSASVHPMSADRFVSINRIEFDLAFLDPPYDFGDWEHLLEVVPANTAVLESGTPVDLPATWVEIRSSRYGRAHVVVAERCSGPDESGF